MGRFWRNLKITPESTLMSLTILLSKPNNRIFIYLIFLTKVLYISVLVGSSASQKKVKVNLALKSVLLWCNPTKLEAPLHHAGILHSGLSYKKSSKNYQKSDQSLFLWNLKHSFLKMFHELTFLWGHTGKNYCLNTDTDGPWITCIVKNCATQNSFKLGCSIIFSTNVNPPTFA